MFKITNRNQFPAAAAPAPTVIDKTERAALLRETVSSLKAMTVPGYEGLKETLLNLAENHSALSSKNLRFLDLDVRNEKELPSWVFHLLELIVLNSSSPTIRCKCMAALSKQAPPEASGEKQASLLGALAEPDPGLKADEQILRTSLALRALSRKTELLPSEQSIVMRIATGYYPTLRRAASREPHFEDVPRSDPRWLATGVLFSHGLLSPERLKTILEADSNLDLMGDRFQYQPPSLEAALFNIKMSGWTVQASDAVIYLDPALPGKLPDKLADLPALLP